MSDDPKGAARGRLPNLLAWLSFIGLFATGAVGLVGAIQAVPNLAGAAYLLVGGLAFSGVLFLVLRREP